MTVNNMKNHAPQSVSHTSPMPIKVNLQAGTAMEGNELTF